MLRLLLLAYIAHTHKGFNYASGDTIVATSMKSVYVVHYPMQSVM